MNQTDAIHALYIHSRVNHKLWIKLTENVYVKLCQLAEPDLNQAGSDLVLSTLNLL